MAFRLETRREFFEFFSIKRDPVMDVVDRYQGYLEAYGTDRALQEGQAWYPNALETCKQIAEVDGQGVVPLERVVALMATYSPRKRWSHNVQLARQVVRTWAERGVYDPVGALPYGRARGEDILHHPGGGEEIHNPYAGFAFDSDFEQFVTGPKVQAFYQNILGNPNPVTVDVVMNKAAGNESEDVGVKERKLITHAVNILAERFGVAPRDMQAAIWIAYRGSAD